MINIKTESIITINITQLVNLALSILGLSKVIITFPLRCPSCTLLYASLRSINLKVFSRGIKIFFSSANLASSFIPHSIGRKVPHRIEDPLNTAPDKMFGTKRSIAFLTMPPTKPYESVLCKMGLRSVMNVEQAQSFNKGV